MKKVLISLLMISVLLVSVGFVMAVKPTGKLASAEKVPWHLSADVMPVPPYGSGDIPGSDTTSKLIVNQPNGAVEVTITGAMNGLNPDTTYTAYLSNGYTPYMYTGWSVEGDWVLEFDWKGGKYIHDMTIDNNVFTGTGAAQFSSQTWTVVGTINGDIVEMTIDYDGSSYYVDVVGTIESDGTMSGTWLNPTQSGTWTSTSGQATDHTGDTGWSQLFTSTIQPFTFTTDGYGAGSWHINLRDADFLPGAGTYDLSVWINEAGRTMLISDNFEVTTD